VNLLLRYAKVGLGTNEEKSKSIFMSRHQNTEQNPMRTLEIWQNQALRNDNNQLYLYLSGNQDHIILFISLLLLKRIIYLGMTTHPAQKTLM
jgi:hypothetical protein